MSDPQNSVQAAWHPPLRVVLPLAVLTAAMVGAIQGLSSASSRSLWAEGLRGGLFAGVVMLTIVSCKVGYKLGYEAGRAKA